MLDVISLTAYNGMNLPFDNDTRTIVQKLAKKNLKANISDLDDETARIIQNDDRVLAGFSYLMGMIDYGEYKVTVRSVDENLMQLVKYPALNGRLPETETEVAVTQGFLDRKGVSCGSRRKIFAKPEALVFCRGFYDIFLRTILRHQATQKVNGR